MAVLGKFEVLKVHEMELNGFKVVNLIPAVDERMLEQYAPLLPEGTTQGGFAQMNNHAWLVRSDNGAILIDTGAGNGKQRPQQPVLSDLKTSFLERLRDVGVTPETVDYVLHTHIHSDHVGWNTTYVDGAWEPTFPNATHICSRLEWDYGEALADGDEERVKAIQELAGHGKPIRVPVSGTFDDSMRPLRDSGQVRLVEVNGDVVLPGIRFLPTPGHSIDHAAVELFSDGWYALFGGDVMHHAVELIDTDLVSVFCEFPDAARRSRRWLLERAAQPKTLYFTAHFPQSSMGTVTRLDEGYEWNFTSV